ncbi:MAG: hypothetical protein FJZ56_03300 [Chlamydiae bacterium]|nr:hypothetical protein [Chlamydiota bacterium]
MKIVCLAIIAIFVTGCSTPHFVLVKDEAVTKQRLASSFVKSPDPERTSFKPGQRLIVEWLLPYQQLKADKLTLCLHVMYGNLEEEVVEYPVNTIAGFVSHLVLDPQFTEKKGVISYKAEIIDSEKNIIESFKQKLWVEPVTPGKKSS